MNDMQMDNSIQKPRFLLETRGFWVILWKPHEILDLEGGFCWMGPQIVPKKQSFIHLNYGWWFMFLENCNSVGNKMLKSQAVEVSQKL